VLAGYSHTSQEGMLHGLLQAAIKAASTDTEDGEERISSPGGVCLCSGEAPCHASPCVQMLDYKTRNVP